MVRCYLTLLNKIKNSYIGIAVRAIKFSTTKFLLL